MVLYSSVLSGGKWSSSLQLTDLAQIMETATAALSSSNKICLHLCCWALFNWFPFFYITSWNVLAAFMEVSHCFCTNYTIVRCKKRRVSVVLCFSSFSWSTDKLVQTQDIHQSICPQFTTITISSTVLVRFQRTITIPKTLGNCVKHK